MEKIKFRAWDGTSWYSFNLATLGNGSPTLMRLLSNDETVVVQFTGLTDKNGKEIYDGDIVNIDDVGKCKVVYLDHSMKFYFESLEGFAQQFTARPETIEVIGNIYQNLELIK